MDSRPQAVRTSSRFSRKPACADQIQDSQYSCLISAWRTRRLARLASNKLFIEAEWLPECQTLLARRYPRSRCQGEIRADRRISAISEVPPVHFHDGVVTRQSARPRGKSPVGENRL